MTQPVPRRAALRAGALAVAGLAGCTGGQPSDGGSSAPAGHDWPTYRFDPANTGANLAAKPPAERVAPAWSARTGQWAEVPTLVGGVVYVGDETGRLLALDAADGGERWNADLGRISTGAPAVVDGSVYVASFPGNGTGAFHALDAATGEPRWSTPDGGPVPPVVADGHAFTATREGTVYRLAVDGGDRVWRTSVEGRVQSGLAFAGDAVFVATRERGTETGAVRALRVADGSERWSAATNGVSFSAPAVREGTLYVPDRTGVVRALATADGEERWTAELDASFTCPPAVAGGTVFVGSHEGTLYALRGDDGAVRWTADGVGFVNSGPARAGDALFLATEAGLFAFDAETGERRWRVSADVPLYGAIVSDGSVYTGSYRPRDGDTPTEARARVFAFRSGAG